MGDLVAEARRAPCLDMIPDLAAEIESLRAREAELVEALELTEALDFREDCPECGGLQMPELCGTCFPKADEARLKRRAVLARADEEKSGG